MNNLPVGRWNTKGATCSLVLSAC